jgi:hypothetical protein
MHSSAETQETPNSSAQAEPFGLGTAELDHSLPFQRRAIDFSALTPIAVQEVEDVQEIALIEFSPPFS